MIFVIWRFYMDPLLKLKWSPLQYGMQDTKALTNMKSSNIIFRFMTNNGLCSRFIKGPTHIRALWSSMQPSLGIRDWPWGASRIPTACHLGHIRRMLFDSSIMFACQPGHNIRYRIHLTSPVLDRLIFMDVFTGYW